MATGIQTGMRTGSRSGLSAGRGAPGRLKARIWAHPRVRAVAVLFALLGLGVGLGWALHQPGPLTADLVRARVVLRAAAGTGEFEVSLSQRQDGGRWVVLGLTPQARISPEAARALVGAELDLRGSDRLAVLSLPPRFDYLALWRGMAAVILVLGATLLVVRWQLPLRLLLGLGRARTAWRASRRPPPPAPPRLEPRSRLVIEVPARQRVLASRALGEFRERMAGVRGVLLPRVEPEGGATFRLSLDGRVWASPGDLAELVASLEARLPELLGLEEVGQLLEAWRRTHPAVVEEALRQYDLATLRLALTGWLRRGQDLRSLDRLLERLLEESGDEDLDVVLDRLVAP